MRHENGQEVSFWIKGVAVVAGTAAFLGACGNNGSNEVVQPNQPAVTSEVPTTQSMAPPTTVASPESSQPSDCTDIEVPVFPNSRLKSSNAEDVNTQIDALAAAYNDAPVTADNVLNALSITANASVDPAYAEALAYEQEHLAGGEAAVTAEQLLAMDFSNETCLSDQQIHEIDNLFKALVTGYAPKIGEQTSATAKLLYNKLSREWAEFKQKHLEN